MRKDRATVVCIGAQGRDRKLLDCFSVSIEGQEEQSQQMLADHIARACSERGVTFAEAAVALDCAMFMQHAVHSEFSDYKKIAATVRFDTEEALAMDVADVAVAFRIASSDENGSKLDVYTTQRSVLSDILFSLQANRIDPVIVDPDVYCLSRYLKDHDVTAGPSTQSPLYALLSDSRGYLVGISSASEASIMRAFPVGPVQQREPLLAREIRVTTALAEAVGPTDRLCVFDAKSELAAQPLAERLGLPAKVCSLAEMAGIEPADMADCSNAVDFALAYGAALGLPEKDRSVNFRNDHMPYLGAKRRRQKALKFVSISLTVLLLAAGLFFHRRLLDVNADRTRLRKKFEPDYLVVMLGKEKLPPTMKRAVDDLEGALRQLSAEKTGIGAGESISAKLTLVLQALNSCAAQTDLNIDSITITERNIVINGDTSSRRNTVSGVFEAMKENGLEIQPHSMKSDAGRDSFSMTVQPKKQLERN